MEREPKLSGEEMIFADHLEELDDLRYGRNAPLEDTAQNREDLRVLVDAIINKVQASGKKAVLFLCSPRLRAQETAHLAGEEIRERLGDAIKIRYSVNDDLRPYEEGEFILPEDYEPNDRFEGLKAGSRIFIEESLGPAHNLNYRYGDPLKQPDGSFKYPELAQYFKKSGETYAEALGRVLRSVGEMAGKADKLRESTEVVLVSHGFVFHILRGLIAIADEVKGGMELKEGELARKIYEHYRNETADVKSLAYIPLDITDLGDEHLRTILAKEIELLKGRNV